ncbi:MAG: hypothetical protein FD123_2200 [Bacteroidetes bacterium]|nr:MAG: hypothetical protein FD123_2200 [Bacteroidota bacterium]
MKKVLSIVAIAGMAMLASCGNAEELKRIADSLKQDSQMRADNEKKMADSLKADSQMKADAAQKTADSMKAAAAADSAANADKKGKK